MSALRRLWSLREERPVFVAVTAGVLAFLLVYPVIDWYLRTTGVASPFRFWDWGAYTGAIEQWSAGEPIYTRDEDGGYHGSYLYPPVFLLLFYPFVELLPFRQAAMAFHVVQVGLLWVGLQLVVGTFDYGLRLWERVGLLWLLLGFHPLLLSLKLGQISPLLSAMLAFAYVGLARGEGLVDGVEASRPARFASGLFTALGGLVKLPYAPVGAHLLQDRDRFAGAVLTGLALVALSLALFGVEAHRTYIEVLTWGKGWTDVPRPPTLWLPPYFRPLLVFGAGAVLLRLAGSLVVAVFALLAEGADREVFALGVTAMPLLAPQADAYYLVATLPAVLVLLATELRRDGRPLVPVVAVFLLGTHSYGLKLLVDELPSMYPAWQALEPLYPVLQPGLWGVLLLAVLAGARVGERVSPLAWLARWGSGQVTGTPPNE